MRLAGASAPGCAPTTSSCRVDGRDGLDQRRADSRHLRRGSRARVARLDVLRDGRRQSRIGEADRASAARSGDSQSGTAPSERPVAIADTGDDSPLGLTVREFDAAFARRLEIPASVQGVVVAARRARRAPRSSRRSGAASSSWKSTASRCGPSPTSSEWCRRRDPARHWLSMATIRRSDSVRS